MAVRFRAREELPQTEFLVEHQHNVVHWLSMPMSMLETNNKRSVESFCIERAAMAKQVTSGLKLSLRVLNALLE